MSFEVALQQALNTSSLTPTGRYGGGCINQGEAYMVDSGTVFVKMNQKKNARLMFDGELQSLQALADTHTVSVPQPLLVLDNPEGGAALVMEYLDMKSLRKFSCQLAEGLARLHLYNIEACHKEAMNSNNICKQSAGSNVSKFGFHVPTCCGYIPMDNTWQDDWMIFFARNRLDVQIKMIEKDFGDREALELWSQLKLKLSKFFQGITVLPSLLHGDLWSGNVGETNEGPVIFDPASFYGHSEYELAISSMFGGFGKTFYMEYHKKIPQTPGFYERQDLYKLFHNLNHWNHFGTGYRTASIKLMKSLLK